MEHFYGRFNVERVRSESKVRSNYERRSRSPGDDGSRCVRSRKLTLVNNTRQCVVLDQTLVNAPRGSSRKYRDDFTPEKRPLTREEKEEELSKMERAEEGGLPPYNGFGTHEDSAINCRTVNPASAVKSYRQFYAMDKEGYDSRVLRFSAKLISKEASDRVRSFIVSYYLVDDTISVFEKSNPYEGRWSKGFERGNPKGRPHPLTSARSPADTLRTSMLFVMFGPVPRPKRCSLPLAACTPPASGSMTISVLRESKVATFCAVDDAATATTSSRVSMLTLLDGSRRSPN
ncbi:hypothetical protein AAG570_000043 [Ranatra chinensis]|uniref:DM10 domain-containing protein n=1 Tax=Ranatra chinensis TaxID=642074 RepID=A0ABD0YVY0_9HEMI